MPNSSDHILWEINTPYLFIKCQGKVLVISDSLNGIFKVQMDTHEHHLKHF